MVFVQVAGLLALVAAPLVSSLPHANQRTARIIPVARRDFTTSGPDKVFDFAAAAKEKKRIYYKYGNIVNKKPSSPPVNQKRAEALEPFDINVVRKRKRQQNAAVALTDANDQDTLYFAPISIGTPPQQTTVIFDTGSSDLVVPTTGCNPQQCFGQLFNTANSSSFQASNTPFTITYGDGTNAQGTVSTDTVNVNGLTISNQPFAAITQAQGFNGPNSGILGMGFPGNAVSKANPWFFNLANNNALSSNLFSFFLSRGGASGSELCVGCLDSSRFTGNVQFFPLDPGATQGEQLFWNIASSGMSVNGSTPAIPFSAVIDSGTSLIVAPTNVTQALFAQIPGSQAVSQDVAGESGFFSFPCASNPVVSFVFGNSSFDVNPLDFNLGQNPNDPTQCIGGILGEDALGENLAIVGDEFMKNWYSVFDLGNSQVGFAQAV